MVQSQAGPRLLDLFARMEKASWSEWGDGAQLRDRAVTKDSAVPNQAIPEEWNTPGVRGDCTDRGFDTISAGFQPKGEEDACRMRSLPSGNLGWSSFTCWQTASRSRILHRFDLSW